jgi:ATP synthase protein I
VNGGLRARLPHLPVTLGATAALLVVGVLVGWAIWGGVGAAGMAAGIGIVAASYLFSTIAIAWADTIHPRMVMSVGLVAYAAKFTAIGFIMVALESADWAGLPAMGFGVIAGVVVWTGSQIWWIRHNNIPHVNPADVEAEEPAGSDPS